MIFTADLPLPPKRKSYRKFSDEEIAAAYAQTGNVWKAADLIGWTGQQVHARIVKLGIARNRRHFSEVEIARLTADYRSYVENGRLDELAAEMSRDRTTLCGMAKKLGLTDADGARKRSIATAQASPKLIKRWSRLPHPRGMAGKKHSAVTKERISQTSTQYWVEMSDDERSAATLKQMKAKAEKYGSVAGAVKHGSWKSAWREIGGQRKFYRSAWEANYARYLNWLQQRGDILDWKHEPETFWFDKIRRGVRSYLPDFRVWENDGTTKLHEVKGWMDARSHTTLKRMAKYHPHETIVLIRAKQYQDITKKLGRLIEGWES